MTGLRQRQKADRDRRILQAAVSQFREHGFRAVRIEDLAEEAGVSVGTVYNYYSTKGDILVAVVAMEVEEVLEAGAQIVAKPPRGVGRAINKLIYTYYDHSLHYLSKEMWRSAMALAIEAPNTPNGRRYRALDARLSDQVIDLVAALQTRGEVRAEIDPAPIGAMIFNDLNQAFIEFVTDEAMSLRALRDRVGLRMRQLATLIETPPRNGAAPAEPQL